MSRTLKIIVTLSLLLNLLLAGILVGHWCRGMMPSPAMRMHEQILQISKALPAEKREHFDAVMRRAEDDADDFHKQFDLSRAQANRILKANKFDREAFIAQMKDIEQIHAESKRRLSLAIADAAGELSPQERATMADLLRPPLPPTPAVRDKQ